MAHNKPHHGPAKSMIDGFLNPKTRRTDLTKHTIRHDRFDKEAYEHLLEEMDDFAHFSNRLGEFVPQSGKSAFIDSFLALVKAQPRLEDPRDVRPSHLVNRAVMGEAVDLPEYEKLHRYSYADEIGSALGAITMEPALEKIFDRLQSERDLADELQRLMEEYLAQQEQMDALEDMSEQDMEPGEAEDFQTQKSLIQQQMEMLQQQMEGTATEIDDQLKAAESDIQAGMREAMNKAIEDADLAESTAQAWGLSQGGIKHLPADERIRLAQRLNNERFRRIAQLFGPMQRMALAEQTRKVYHAADEIMDVEQGSDLTRVLPSELAMLKVPGMQIDFLRRWVDKRLLQYKLEGTEKVAKGGIIFEEDGSGSMMGGREIWAKAVGLCLLRIAQQQKRPFYAVHFGGTGEAKEYDFPISDRGRVSTRHNGSADEDLSYLDGVMDFAEVGFGGGTDFMTPLSIAMAKCKADFQATGKVDADIVFCTDGMCGVDPSWLEDFKEQQKALGVRIWGIVIGGSPRSEPLASICDGRVFEISDLTSGNEMAEIFRAV